MLQNTQRNPQRRQRHPTPVFLPGESQGRGSLVGCRLWGRTESDTTERLSSRETQHSSRCWGATSIVVLGARVCLVAQLCLTLCDPVECSPCPPPEDLPNPGIKPRSPALWVDSLPSEPPGKPRSSQSCIWLYHQWSGCHSGSRRQRQGPFPDQCLADYCGSFPVDIPFPV